MLPFIIGGLVLGALAYSMDDSENKKRSSKRKKLAKQEEQYENKLTGQYNYNQNKKRSILFKEIKYEQSKLKEERRELAKIRNALQRGSLEHKTILKQISLLTQKIDQKQKDADRARG
jgi:flagellar biosynthesis component FlhA